MFCEKCGNQLNEEGICTACTANTEPAAETEEIEAPAVEAIEEIPVAEPVDAEAPELPTVDPGKTFGIISMVLGIVAILLNTVCSCIPLLGCFTAVVALIAAIVGVILGFVAMNKSKAAGFKNTFALVGMILSIASVALWIVSLIVSLIFGSLPALFSANTASYRSY